MPILDISGQRFGNLIAEKICGRKNGNVLWKCKCDCGNYTESNSQILKKGKKKSCGCLIKLKQKEKFIGKKFNHLFIKQYSHHKNGRAYYKFQCDCGHEDIITAQQIGRTNKCKKCANFKGYGDLSGSYIASVRQGAISRNLEFSISVEECWNKFIEQKGKCAITGEEIFLEKTYNKNQTASLDRIDSSKGYILGNIQWVHKYINYMKWDFSNKEFVDWCRKVIDYLGRNDIGDGH